MTKTATCSASIVGLLLAISVAHAGPCTQSIVRVQAQVDAAIEKRAGSDGARPESLSALRGYQPTLRSLAAAEGNNGRDFQAALDSLERARAADQAGDAAACRRQLAQAKAVLQQQRH